MEEFFLGAVTFGEEVDVVDDENVYVAVAMTEFVHLARLDAFEELVHECIAGDVKYVCIGICSEDLLTDCLEEVGFAEAYAAMDEEWVVGGAGLIGDGDGSCVGELVVGACDEVFERVVG